MGKLAFVFEVFSHEVFEKKEVFFGMGDGSLEIRDERWELGDRSQDKRKPFDKQFIVVFVSTNKTKSDIVIGMHDFLHNDECKFVFLNSTLGFSDYLIFEGAIFKYAKLCVYEMRVVDFSDLTFWFDVKRYKEIRDILTLNNLEGDLEDELKRRVLKLLEYF